MQTNPQLTSGLDIDSQFVLGETREEFAQLVTEYYTHYTAHDPEQRYYLDTAIRNEWLLRRFHRVEAHLWEFETMKGKRDSGCELGEAFDKTSPTFMRLHRRIVAAERSYKDAMNTFRKLQKPAPETEQTKEKTQQLGSFRTAPRDPDQHPADAAFDAIERELAALLKSE
jgi:hypothetical protein